MGAQQFYGYMPKSATSGSSADLQTYNQPMSHKQPPGGPPVPNMSPEPLKTANQRMARIVPKRKKP